MRKLTDAIQAKVKNDHVEVKTIVADVVSNAISLDLKHANITEEGDREASIILEMISEAIITRAKFTVRTEEEKLIKEKADNPQQYTRFKSVNGIVAKHEAKEEFKRNFQTSLQEGQAAEEKEEKKAATKKSATKKARLALSIMDIIISSAEQANKDYPNNLEQAKRKARELTINKISTLQDSLESAPLDQNANIGAMIYFGSMVTTLQQLFDAIVAEAAKYKIPLKNHAASGSLAGLNTKTWVEFFSWLGIVNLGTVTLGLFEETEKYLSGEAEINKAKAGLLIFGTALTSIFFSAGVASKTGSSLPFFSALFSKILTFFLPKLLYVVPGFGLPVFALVLATVFTTATLHRAYNAAQMTSKYIGNDPNITGKQVLLEWAKVFYYGLLVIAAVLTGRDLAGLNTNVSNDATLLMGKVANDFDEIQNLCCVALCLITFGMVGTIAEDSEKLFSETIKIISSATEMKAAVRKTFEPLKNTCTWYRDALSGQKGGRTQVVAVLGTVVPVIPAFLLLYAAYKIASVIKNVALRIPTFLIAALYLGGREAGKSAVTAVGFFKPGEGGASKAAVSEGPAFASVSVPA